MSDIWSRWLAAEADLREQAGLVRSLTPRPADDATLDLAGNDYLGLSRDPEVRQAAAEAALRWGAGAGASRLVTGTLGLHADLEQALADYTGQEAALVFSSGYLANLAIVNALADRSARVISDAHIHASLVDAVRLSKAQLTITPHNDVDAVREALRSDVGRWRSPSAPRGDGRSATSSTSGAAEIEEGALAPVTRSERTLVLCESVYSVLGDRAPLAELAEAAEEHDALLVVDEAHGLGVHGPGLVAEAGLAGHPHVVVTATLSKSLGSQGGAVLGPARLREHLVNRARPFIYDTALAPAPAAAALAALNQLRARPDLSARVQARVADLAAALGVPPSDGAVLSIPMPSPQAAVAAQAAALEHEVRVGCFRPPSVPDGVSRLRVTVSAGISDDDWVRATEVLVAVAKEHR